MRRCYGTWKADGCWVRYRVDPGRICSSNQNITNFSRADPRVLWAGLSQSPMAGCRASTLRYLFSQPCKRASLDIAGKTLAFSQGRIIRVLPRDRPSTLHVINGFAGLSMLSVSPGGRWIAAGNWRGNQTQVWEAGTGKIVADLLPDTESVNVLFSPRGKWLVTGTSRDYRIWSVDSWKEAARFDRPERFSNLPGIMAFSPDDSLVAAAMTQSRIQIFHMDTGKLLLTLEPPGPQSIQRSSVHCGPKTPDCSDTWKSDSDLGAPARSRRVESNGNGTSNLLPPERLSRMRQQRRNPRRKQACALQRQLRETASDEGRWRPIGEGLPEAFRRVLQECPAPLPETVL